MYYLPALELLAARATTSSVLEPARLILQHLLAADAWLLDKERTFGARGIGWMTLVLDLGVPARRRLPTVIPTFGGFRSAWLGRQ